MKLTVHYMAHLKQAAGKPTEEIDVDSACSVATLLQVLAARRGDGLRRLLLDSKGSPQPTVLVFVNDQQVEPTHVLVEGDEVSLLSPIAGG